MPRLCVAYTTAVSIGAIATATIAISRGYGYE